MLSTHLSLEPFFFRAAAMCQGFCFPSCPIAGRADARMRRLKPHPRFSRFLLLFLFSSLVNIPISYKTNSLTRRTLLYIHPYLAASCICRLPTKPSTSYYFCCITLSYPIGPRLFISCLLLLPCFLLHPLLDLSRSHHFLTFFLLGHAQNPRHELPRQYS
ncbi:hypothetical protein V8C40DRAFT_80906 [Trichoderma camerunense]